MPTARPPSTTMRLGSVVRRMSPPLSCTAASSARASAAVPPRDICALAGLASSAAIWWPNPRTRRSTSRSPLKKSKPALTVGCSNSCATNSSGDSALTSSSRRPAALRASSARRSSGGSGDVLLSGARMRCTIGTKSSCQRLSVSASRRLNSANEAMVRSMSVHHSSARPSLVSSATLSSGSM